MSFARRIISLTFTKGVGTFAESGTNQLTVSGLRVQCNIINVGGVTMGEAQLRIYGLTKQSMIDLSALNGGFMVQRMVELEIRAGDDIDGLELVFDGQIRIGQIDLNNAPDSALIVLAYGGIMQALQVATATSYPMGTDHITVMKDLAARMGLGFESTGFPISLATPYYPGTLRDQTMRCADAAGVNWTIDSGMLIVWPRLGVRTGTGAVPLVSPDTGMVGYPAYSEIGIAVKTMFNPRIRLGALVTVASSLPFANGTWGAFFIRHELESETPSGKWFTSFDGQPYIGQ